MANTPDLKFGAERLEGSNPFSRTWHHHDTQTEERSHEHVRGDEPHRHRRDPAKTYFKHETVVRDGVSYPVKCEGHWSVDMDIIDDWAYEKGAL